MSTEVDYDVAMENAHHEAVIRQSYKDGAGVWTWSFGLTGATGHRVDRYIGNIQPMQKCIDIYVWALDNYAKSVRETFKGINLTKAQFAAALSFHWNTGAIKRASWVNDFKAGRMTQAEASLKTWNKSAGKKVEGLVHRRKKEADLLFRGKWSNNGTVTEFTRLTSKATPDWGSAKIVNIEKELKAALGQSITPPVIDQPPQPDKEPKVPTLTPTDYLIKLGMLGYSSVEEFQLNHPHLIQDGILGPKTREQIDRDWNAKNEAPGVAGGVVVGAGIAAWLAANGHDLAVVVGVVIVGLISWFVIRRRVEIIHWIKNFRDN